jgi:acetyl esterase/lipase
MLAPAPVALLGLGCSLLAFLPALLIVVPAPRYWLWVTAVGATEWSLWLGALGIVGAVLGTLTFPSRPGIAAVVLGTVALALSLVPLVRTLPIARQGKVRLSLSAYLTDNGPSWGRNIGMPPETVTFAEAGGQSLKLDAYRAAGQVGALAPAIIVVHGGSWRAGDKGDFPHWNRWLVAHGYAVFDIQYRLEPAPNWRKAAADVRTAVAWVKANATRYQIDPDRLALLGRSAGGHLALLAAYTPDTQPDTSVKVVVSYYAPTDLVWGYNNPARPDVIDGPGILRRFLGGTPETAPQAFTDAAPIYHVRPGVTPATLLFHGGEDRLVGAPHMDKLGVVLAEQHIPHSTVLIPYALHGFDYHLGGWGSQIAQTALLRFLKAHL